MHRRSLALRALFSSAFLFAAVAVGAPVEAKPVKGPAYAAYLTGNAADVAPALHGPSLLLGGGGTDVDAGFQRTIDLVRGCTSCSTTIDIVILRSTGADGYNAYLQAMNGVDSVETLVLDRPEEAADPAVVAKVQKAELVFFAGGDQCDYVKNFKGTPVEAAVQDVYARGGAVGGTSAGLAIQGDYAYDACSSSSGVSSATALANPYSKEVTFTNDFFDWAPMTGLITDSHFVTRDRMGRLMVFLARQIADGATGAAWGLGVNEGTSVVVDDAGTATVVGDGPVYLVLADHPATVIQAKKPLTYAGFKIWKFGSGQSFSLTSRPSTGFTTIDVNAGVLGGSPY